MQSWRWLAALEPGSRYEHIVTPSNVRFTAYSDLMFAVRMTVFQRSVS